MFTRIIRTSSFSPPPFTPASIANLVAWYQGSDFDATTNGADVPTWSDQSGHGNTQTAIGSAGNQPVVARNAINTNMTAVKGTNSTDGMQKSSFPLSSANTWTAFAVINFTALPAGGSHNIFFGFDNQLSDGMWIGVESTGQIQMTIPNTGTWLSNESVSASTWYYIVVRNVSGTVSVYVNGTLFTWASTAGSNGNANGNFGLFRTNSGAGNRGNCQIAEFALYNAAVSTGDRTNLEGYAHTRFGI